MKFNEFIGGYGKKIIVTDEVSVTNKLIRKYARNTNIPVYGVKVMNLVQVASQVMFAYDAMFEADKKYVVIDNNMQVMRLLLCLKELDLPFLEEKSKNINTAHEFLSVLNQIRFNKPTESFINSQDVKTAGLRQILSSYESMLRENNELDNVMVLRNATEILKHLVEQGNATEMLEACVFDFAGSKISTFFSNKLTVLEKTFFDLFVAVLKVNVEKLEVKEDSQPGCSLYKAYGIENEVRKIISFIKEEADKDDSLHYGDFAIMYPVPGYENVLRAELDSAGIPYSFPRGFYARGTEYISLINTLLDFVEHDFLYEVLYDVLNNSVIRIKGKVKAAYRSFLRHGIGYGRERYLAFFEYYDNLPSEEKNEEYEEFYAFLKGIIECFDETKNSGELFRTLLSLLNKYSDTQDYYRVCVKDELKAFAAVLDMVGSVPLNETISCIRLFLRNLKCCTSESYSAVNIYPYGRIESVGSRYLFVIGLSSENIESVVTESPVLCDRELKEYVSGEIRFAKERNKRKLAAFKQTLEYSSPTNIYFSYSEYDLTSRLKSTGSVLFREIQRKTGKKVDSYGYGDYDLPKDDIKFTYPAGRIDLTNEEIDRIKDNSKYFSASSIQTLINCPMEYYFNTILKLPKLEFAQRRPDQWLQANVRGNVFHHVIQGYVDQVIIENSGTEFNEEIFDKLFDEEIQHTLMENPVSSREIMEMERDEGKAVLIKYINSLHENLNKDARVRVIGCEAAFEGLTYTKPNKYTIELKGSIDRLDGYVDENHVLKLRIYDYKTGNYKKLKKEADDKIQIQHYIYAYAAIDWASKNKAELEKRFAANIDDIEIEFMNYIFPYDEQNRILTAINTVKQADLPDALDDLFTEIVVRFQNGQIESALEAVISISMTNKKKSEDTCKYCNYKEVCGL